MCPCVVQSFLVVEALGVSRAPRGSPRLGWHCGLNIRRGRVVIAVTDEELLTTSDWPSGFNPHYIRSRSFEDPWCGRYVEYTVEIVVKELRLGECVDMRSYGWRALHFGRRFLIVHEL